MAQEAFFSVDDTGTLRLIESNDVAAADVLPNDQMRLHRASHIEVLNNKYYIDFTPLADATGDDRYRGCLGADDQLVATPEHARLFDRYGEAVEAEVAWLTKHYLLGGPHGQARRQTRQGGPPPRDGG